MPHRSNSRRRTSFSTLLQSARDAVGLLEHKLGLIHDTGCASRIDLLEKRTLGDQHRLGHDALLDARHFKSGFVPDGRKDFSFGLVCFPPKDGPEVGQSFAFEILLLIHKPRYSCVSTQDFALVSLTTYSIHAPIRLPSAILHTV